MEVLALLILVALGLFVMANAKGQGNPNTGGQAGTTKGTPYQLSVEYEESDIEKAVWDNLREELQEALRGGDLESAFVANKPVSYIEEELDSQVINLVQKVEEQLEEQLQGLYYEDKLSDGDYDNQLKRIESRCKTLAATLKKGRKQRVALVQGRWRQWYLTPEFKNAWETGVSTIKQEELADLQGADRRKECAQIDAYQSDLWQRWQTSRNLPPTYRQLYFIANLLI